MDIFLKNWLPITLLLCLSIGAWLVGFLFTRKKGTGKKGWALVLCSAVSLLSNLALIYTILASGGGIEHITVVLLLSLLFTLY